ncbi:MAG: PP2C family protein-serine/threonine phosphatase [Ilumatobacteraceae bacterium]
MGCTEVAVEYRSHNHELHLGGDWYDLIDRDDGKVVAIVGDVVGHGVEQIGVMGQLRAASNALARSCGDPHELLADLDKFAGDVPGAAMATMAVLMLDGTTEARTAMAGHPPLLHVTDDGVVNVVEDGRRSPLTFQQSPAATARFDYAVDDLLVMFTDGLIERRHEDFDEAIQRLGELLVPIRDEPCADIAARVVDELAPGAGDDITLMVLRPRNHRSPDFLLQPQEPPTVRLG